MKKKLRGLFLTVIAALCLVFPVSAESPESQTYSIPVTLTVVHAAKHINVTLPAALPVSIADGKILTASNLKIENHADSVSVRVSSIEVRNGSFSVVSYADFPETGRTERIALRINGCETMGPGALALTDAAFPVISAGHDLPIRYQAKVAMTERSESTNAAYVIFTLKAADD